MALTLPTDTQHVRLQTRQYELFNRPLGQGIERSKVWTAVAAGLVWFSLLALIGINPLTRFGPLAYLGPVAGFVINGTRVGDDGRMVLLAWYDALLAKLPRRRRRITNPLLHTDDAAHEVLTMQVTSVVGSPQHATKNTRRRQGAAG